MDEHRSDFEETMDDFRQETEGLHHEPYVNARGEVIDNGTDRNAVCGWGHRETCPMCRQVAQERYGRKGTR